MTGSPTLLVRINESGDLIEATVSKSSGSALLDLASVDIIQRASPFDEFPAAMASEYETVAFEYKFLFSEQLVTGRLMGRYCPYANGQFVNKSATYRHAGHGGSQFQHHGNADL